MGDTFDDNEPSKLIAYLDANNLYGWAMSKPLPTVGFAWMTEDELNNWCYTLHTSSYTSEFPTL